MRRAHLRRGLAAAALVPLLAGLSACGDDDKDAVDSGAKPGTQACAGLPSADSAATLPTGFPALGDQLLYEPSMQGTTKIVYGLLDESDFVEVRDELVDKLKAASYKIEGTDQESVEAEAEFSGPQRGTIKVQPLCKGHVSIRYKFLG
ncbi:MAG TPA: hypothetical protein VMZ11_00165 [Mycobacteriales bacterium]|nr:hypothetical protein [Mycobacteriales bacterium]